MHEFDFIARVLSPLAQREAGALGLKDDAALLTSPGGHELVLTKDALVESVHFVGNEPPADIARKALRVNLSDCAAMGATPYAYMMALMLPPTIQEGWLRDFVSGLQDDQNAFALNLIGGDTTRTTDKLAISITLLGLVPTGSALTRSGAQAGDDIYVSGTLGDAALGLHIAQNLPAANEHEHYVLGRYRVPEPRIALGQSLRGIATACMDISDGLAQDLGHICAASQLGATLHYPAIPRSAAAHAIHYEPETILAGGDDYELLFTASPASAAPLSTWPNITKIGKMTAKTGVQVLDAQGNPITLQRSGYQHF